MGKRVDPRRAKIHWTRSYEEWARRLGVHRNTIARWAKDKGLEVDKDQKPYLIKGSDLRRFLEARKKQKRFNCGTGEMPCFSCNKPRRPAIGCLEYHPQSATHGDLLGLCEVCASEMNRKTRLVDIPRLFPEHAATLTGCQRTLCGSTERPVNGGFGRPSKAARTNTTESSRKPVKGATNG